MTPAADAPSPSWLVAGPAAAVRAVAGVVLGVLTSCAAVVVLARGAEAVGVQVPLVLALAAGAALGAISSPPVRRWLERRSEGWPGLVSLAASCSVLAGLLSVLGLALAVPAVCVTASLYATLLQPTTRRVLEGLAITVVASAGSWAVQALGWVDGVASVPATALFGLTVFAVAAPPLFHVAGTGRRARCTAAALEEQRQRHLAELEHAARHDPLTGLLNRRGLAEQLDRAAREAAPGAGSALVGLDLTGFRTVNSVHGHEAGDALLREAARRLLAAARPEGAVARTGGDEFVVVLRSLVDATAARDAAERLRQELSAPFDLAGGVRASVGVSVGTAFSSGGVPVRDLSAVADAQRHLDRHDGRPHPERLR